jgi:hypothetical protein
MAASQFVLYKSFNLGLGINKIIIQLDLFIVYYIEQYLTGLHLKTLTIATYDMI